MTKPSVLFVLTSADQLKNGHPIGWYLPEAAHPYHVLHEHCEITFASPAGGKAPLDKASVEMFKSDEVSVKFLNDPKTKALFEQTKKLSDMKETDFDAILIVGGHGPCVDLAVDPVSISLCEAFFKAGKITSAICHGPGAFANVKTIGGKSIFDGRKATAFSNVEEDQVKLTEAMDFLPEDNIRSNGGLYSKADEPWGSHICVDNDGQHCLITGQNPSSGDAFGKAVLDEIVKRQKMSNI